jgi:hypothetical protein
MASRVGWMGTMALYQNGLPERSARDYYYYWDRQLSTQESNRFH